MTMLLTDSLVIPEKTISELPDAHAWAIALGRPVSLPIDDLVRLAKEHLERQRWILIGEAWPAPGQSVEVVVMKQGTGERFVTSACFNETEAEAPDLLWPWETDDKGQMIPDATLADLNLDLLKRRSYGASFSMSGGDWSACFPGPLFGRRGMDYGEKDNDPLLIITHWRAAGVNPDHLSPPDHLLGFVCPLTA